MSIATKMAAFIEKYGAAAQAAAAGSPVFAQTILSAAALESGYGKSSLAARYNNFFGIKADKSWTGKTVTFPTKEQTKAGKVYTVNAAFRHYDTAEASFRNYVKFIQGPRYVKAGVTKAQSPQEQFEKIHAAGYATDVAYSNKLKNIFNSVKSWAVKNPVKAAGSGLATALVFFCSLST